MKTFFLFVLTKDFFGTSFKFLIFDPFNKVNFRHYYLRSSPHFIRIVFVCKANSDCSKVDLSPLKE